MFSCILMALFLFACGTNISTKSLETAVQERLAGNPQKAVELLLTVVTEDPTNIEAFFELANAYSNLGETEKAAMYYKNMRLAGVTEPITTDPVTTNPVQPMAPLPNGNPEGNVITYTVDNIFSGYLFEGQEVSGLTYESAVLLLKTRYPIISVNEDWGTVITGSSEDGSGFSAVDDGNGNRSINVYTASGGGICVMDASNFGGGIQFLSAYNYSDGGKFNNVGKNAKSVLDEIAPGLYDAVKTVPVDGNVHQWNNIQIMKFGDHNFQIMQGMTGYIIFNADESDTIVDITVNIN